MAPALGAANHWRPKIIGRVSIRRSGSVVRIIAQVWLIGFAVLQVVCQAGKEPSLPVGGKIEDVACDADPAQSYALYLPSTYTATKRWPIIYFFDPGGRGRRPLELYKDIAEKYGFVLAGSNNSRNFSADESKSVNAIWQDTHQRLVLDGHLTYASGFSGGARVAGVMALSCLQCQIAGVIAHGAGYPTNWGEAKDKLLYFFAVGDHDGPPPTPTKRLAVPGARVFWSAPVGSRRRHGRRGRMAGVAGDAIRRSAARHGFHRSNA